MAHVMNDLLAARTVKHYVCSACWGHLLEFHHDDGVLVQCHKCGDETPGFVTKHFANRRLSESGGDLLDVYQIVPNLNPHHGKSEEQLLSELGF